MFYRIELIYFQFIKKNTQVDTIFMKNEIHNCKSVHHITVVILG